MKARKVIFTVKATGETALDSFDVKTKKNIALSFKKEEDYYDIDYRGKGLREAFINFHEKEKASWLKQITAEINYCSEDGLWRLHSTGFNKYENVDYAEYNYKNEGLKVEALREDSIYTITISAASGDIKNLNLAYRLLLRTAEIIRGE